MKFSSAIKKAVDDGCLIAREGDNPNTKHIGFKEDKFYRTYRNGEVREARFSSEAVLSNKWKVVGVRL